jgi:hypothetical protein
MKEDTYCLRLGFSHIFTRIDVIRSVDKRCGFEIAEE